MSQPTFVPGTFRLGYTAPCALSFEVAGQITNLKDTLKEKALIEYRFLDDIELEKMWKDIIPAKCKAANRIPQFVRKVIDRRCLICAPYNRPEYVRQLSTVQALTDLSNRDGSEVPLQVGFVQFDPAQFSIEQAHGQLHGVQL